MRILVDESLWGAQHAFAPCGTVQTFPGRSLRREDLADAEALIVRSVTRVNADLLAGSRVGFVGTATTGTDHVDLDWLAANGITFASAAGSNARPVAEYIIAAILLLAKRHGFDPADKTLGVVGVGRVGSRVVQWTRALGMRVLPHDPPLQRQTGSDEYVSLEALAASADIVTLHVPLTRTGEFATASMVDSAWLSALHRGAVLLNTARGEIIHEPALIDALRTGHITAAVLDVWCNEPNINENLLQHAAIATPHVAGYSLEAKIRATCMIRDALVDWANRAHSQPASVATGAMNVESEPIETIRVCDIDIAPHSPDWQAIHAAVSHACDLAAIDAQLRGLQQAGTLAFGFDELRRSLATRREFGAYHIQGCPADGRAGRALRDVGFHLSD